MKKLNLTKEQRKNAVVTFSVNKYYAHTYDGVLIGSYFSKEKLKEDLKFQEVEYNVSGMAIKIWLSGY